MSSANNIVSKMLLAFGRSLTYSKKRRGPKIEPCGTPQEISERVEFSSSNERYCLRLDK